MRSLEIRQDDLGAEATRRLLTDHLESMLASSPPGHSFALDLTGLRASNVTVWSAWDETTIAGVAAALLAHIIDEARRRGFRRLSLETGSGENFDAALAFYRKHGFVDGEAFADYVRSDFNQFLHLEL